MPVLERFILAAVSVWPPADDEDDIPGISILKSLSTEIFSCRTSKHHKLRRGRVSADTEVLIQTRSKGALIYMCNKKLFILSHCC